MTTTLRRQWTQGRSLCCPPCTRRDRGAVASASRPPAPRARTPDPASRTGPRTPRPGAGSSLCRAQATAAHDCGIRGARRVRVWGAQMETLPVGSRTGPAPRAEGASGTLAQLPG